MLTAKRVLSADYFQKTRPLKGLVLLWGNRILTGISKFQGLSFLVFPALKL